MKEGKAMKNTGHISTGKSPALWRSFFCFVFALATMCNATFAQTTNPPAQPPDWEHPSGPYAVVLEEDAGLPNHTVYRPANLDVFLEKDRLPVVVFSGPGCDANGTAFRPFFTEIASHGFLFIANGQPEPKGGSGPNFPKTKAEDLSTSIDWAIVENGRKDSKYYQRVDISRIAVMGQSGSGAQALVISKDRRINTIVMWNSCSFQFLKGRGITPGVGAPVGKPAAGGGMPAGRGGIPVPDVDKELLTGLRIPIAYFMGGKRDMLYASALSDIELYEAAPLFWASTDLPGDAHAGFFREKNGGQFGAVGVAWLKWQLKGDPKAAKMFKGADCGLCADSRWEVHKKGID
jgi:hypothetical protein